MISDSKVSNWNFYSTASCEVLNPKNSNNMVVKFQVDNLVLDNNHNILRFLEWTKLRTPNLITCGFGILTYDSLRLQAEKDELDRRIRLN